MQGSFASQTSKFIQVAVRDCNQTYLNVQYNYTKQCANASEIARVSSLLKLYFVSENSYFDPEDLSDNPIKKFLTPYYLTS